MLVKMRSIRIAALTAVSTCVLLASVSSQAAPGTLSNSPLFLTNPVEPNVLFLLDDSGSMDWEMMTTEPDGVMNVGSTYYYVQPAGNAGQNSIMPTQEALIAQAVAAPYGGVWRAWNTDYNRLYYNPGVTYTPWPGQNSAGVVYGNVTPTAALLDPYLPAAGSVNLTATTTYSARYAGITFTVNNFYPARYQIWKDSNTNGVVDAADAHQLVEIKSTTPLYTGATGRADCAAAPVCSYLEELQNFANWFSYYRKREYVAKSAFGQVIAGASKSRMGLVTLHNNGTVNTAMSSMNDGLTTGAKRTLLSSVYKGYGSGGTPLRSAFDNSGKYLSCDSNSFFGSCPALPVDSGGACQQNFTIMMTDGYYNGDFSGLGNADGDDNTAWDSGPGGPYGDSTSNTLGDIAMKYYETDIRPSIPNRLVPPPGGLDENTAQHMVTFAMAFGVKGTVNAMPPNAVDPFAWPAIASDANKIDDLRHAAWNGRGDFFSAQSSVELINGMRGALQSIQGRIGSASSVAFNTGSLSTNSEVYLALFNSNQWNGDLLAFDLDPNDGSIALTPNWSAATRLTARDTATRPRTLLTYNGVDGVPFRWSNLTAAQKNDFRTGPDGAPNNEATGMARQGYIRGDRGCEISSSATCSYSSGSDVFNSKSFRERAGRLGDIVHSGPVYVGAPELNWPDVAPFPGEVGETYSEYREAQAARPGVIYVGANDGMLHGFDQSTGQEILGYVPGGLYSTAAANGLHHLSDPAYAHRYHVDLTASIADVYIKTETTGSTSWKTILVGGLRGGGRGVFALDVSNPASFSESNAATTVMWEFTSTNDADLGYTFSRPSIVPLQATGGGIRWAAVFGNGYNDLGSGEAKLFILFLEGGLDGVWTPGSDYIEISTGVGTTTDRNGLSTPAVVDTNGDGMADRVYAGDLKGNMWAFNLSGGQSNNWAVAYKQSTTPRPLFIAPANQQITSTPVVVRNREQRTSASNTPNTLVMFGTGQYLTEGDISTTNTQAMYGVYDSGTAALITSNLVQQTISLGTTAGGVVGRTLTENVVNYASNYGWYMNLPVLGERIVTDPIIRGDYVFFNTMIPNADPCSFGGSGWQMVADWLDGTNPTDEVAFDINRDKLLDSLDEIDGQGAAGMAIQGIATSPVNLANKRYTSTTETTGGSTIEITELIDIGGPRTGRLSWQELEQ